MKKTPILITVFIILICLGLPVSAQETAPVNAGLLLSIWYSNNQPIEGNEIKIFGGFQNHSDKTIEGQAVFFVDGENIFMQKFVSKPGTLIELEGVWKATGGGHKIQIRLTEVDAEILSLESEEAGLNVKRIINKEKVLEFAQETSENLVEKIDNVTQTLSSKILELKKTDPTQKITQSPERSDLKHEFPRSDLEEQKSEPTRSVYNLALSFLSASVLHWKLTLGAIVLLLLIAKFTSR